MSGRTFGYYTPSGYWVSLTDERYAPTYGTAVTPVWSWTPDKYELTYGTVVAPTAWLPMTGGTASHSAVWRTVFDAGWLDRVACGTRRSVAATAVGPSVVP